MKKVLFIAYAYPPIGGGGVQRTLKFTKYLRSYQWEPIILSVDTKNYAIQDSSLCEEIPSGLIIHRVPAYSLMKCWTRLRKVYLHKLVTFIRKYTLIPDEQVFWSISAYKRAKKIIKLNDIRMIYSTAGPYSAHLVGFLLKRKIPNIKWVADFRDEWTTNPHLTNDKIRYNYFRLQIEKMLEKKICNLADKIVVVSKPMAINISANNNVSINKFKVITNGYDSEDFKSLEIHTTNSKDNNKVFTIAYNGSFYGFRKPDNFLQAVYQLIGEKAVDRKKLRLQFVGNTGENLQVKVNEYKLEDICEITGYVNHKKSLELIRAADCLLLFIANIPNAEGIYTGKLFEYLAVARPIIGLVPPKGVAADLIKAANVGDVVASDDIYAIKKALLKYYNDFYAQGIVYNPSVEIIESFDRKKLTSNLAGIFNALAF